MIFKQIREDKEAYNGGRVKGFRAYLFFWMPLLIAAHIYRLVQYFLSWQPGNEFQFLFDVAISGISLLCWITAFVGAWISFITGIIHMALILIYEVSGLIGLFITGAKMTQVYGMVGNALSSIVILTSVFSIILVMIFCGYYIYTFVKNINFFKYNYTQKIEE